MRRFLGLRQSDRVVRSSERVDSTRVFAEVSDEPLALNRGMDEAHHGFIVDHPSAMVEAAPLLASAIRNEEIRIDYEGLITRFAEFDALREDFVGVTRRFVDVVDELEQLKKDKAELQSQVELAEAFAAELRQELSTLEPKYDALVSEAAALQAAGDRGRETIAKLEAAKQKEHEEHQATRDIVKLREADLADARAQIGALHDEISAGRRELDRLSSALAEREVAFEQTASALRSSEEQGRILKTLLDESTFQTARLSRTVSELEPMADRLKSQIVTLQAAVEAEREAKEKAAIERIEGLELLRAELRATTAKLEAAMQRAETQEKMLLSARHNYREKLEELRAVERSVIDLTMQLANMTRRAETAEADKTNLHARVADLELVERGFDERLAELNKALAEKETALILAQGQIVFETSRLEEAQSMARTERARFESEMAEIMKLLDKERVDRTVLEGALLSNRRRQALRGEADEDIVTVAKESGDESSAASVSIERDDETVIAYETQESGAVILEFERSSANYGVDQLPVHGATETGGVQPPLVAS